MLEIMHLAGFAAWAVLVLALAGLVATITFGRRIGRPGSVATGFAVAILAAASLGFGLGQTKVEIATTRVDAQTDVAVALLNQGTMEASQNLLFGGMLALGLLAIGGGLALWSARASGPTRAASPRPAAAANA